MEASPPPKLGITHRTLRTRPVSERRQGRKIHERQCFAFAYTYMQHLLAHTRARKHTHVCTSTHCTHCIHIHGRTHTPCILLFRDRIDNFLQKGARGGGMRKPTPSSSTRQQHDHHHQLHHHHNKRSRAAPASLQGSASKGQEHPMRSLKMV